MKRTLLVVTMLVLASLARADVPSPDRPRPRPPTTRPAETPQMVLTISDQPQAKLQIPRRALAPWMPAAVGRLLPQSPVHLATFGGGGSVLLMLGLVQFARRRTFKTAAICAVAGGSLLFAGSRIALADLAVKERPPHPAPVVTDDVLSVPVFVESPNDGETRIHLTLTREQLKQLQASVADKQTK